MLKRLNRSWQRECNDIIRGACGGFLFGTPLLYTMEVWWIGSYASQAEMLAAIAIMFVSVFLLNRTEGFRELRGQSRPMQALIDTVEAIAIGLICSTIVLVLIRELTFSTSLKETLGKIVFESVPFTLGVALSNQILKEDEQENGNNDDRNNSEMRWRANRHPFDAILSDIGATLMGSLIIAFSIAPTDEVPMITASVSPPWLMMYIVLSLTISYGIVFQAGFSNQKRRWMQRGVFQRPSSETVVAYLVSLLAAALMLWFFQRLTLQDPWTLWLSQSIVLGLPATIGGAAGRLAL